MARPVYKIITAAILIFVLNGCWMPDQFKSELRISKTGDFILTYEGDLVWAPLYAQILEGEKNQSKRLSQTEIDKKINDAQRDLIRDWDCSTGKEYPGKDCSLEWQKYPPGTDFSSIPTAGYSDIRNLGKGRFFVKYERRDRLAPVALATFVRRNNVIISVKGIAADDGSGNHLIEIRGALIRSGDAQRMIDTGMSMQGEFRVTTDARVAVKDGRVMQNATLVKKYGDYTSFIWVIDGPFSRSPYILLEREDRF